MVAHGLALSLVNVDAEYLQGLDIVVERLALGLYAVFGEGGSYLLKGQVRSSIILIRYSSLIF